MSETNDTQQAAPPQPVLYVRMLDGKPDWDEHCVSPNADDLLIDLDDAPEGHGYSVIPLYAALPTADQQPQLRAITEQSCGGCDYDEAEGGLFNHCDKCCRKIATEVYALAHPEQM